MKNTRTCSARPANRRSQSRTVGAGRPSPAATLRCPAPAAAASSAPLRARRRPAAATDCAGSAPCCPRTPDSTVTCAVPAPHPARPASAPAAAAHAPTRSAPRRTPGGQLPARQLPFDNAPVTVYREHDASKRQPRRPSPELRQKDHGEGRASSELLTLPARAARALPATPVTRIRYSIVIGQVPPPTKPPPAGSATNPHRHPQCRRRPHPSES